MDQSKNFYIKFSYSCTNNVIVQNSKSEPKNSHSCVPLTPRPKLTYMQKISSSERIFVTVFRDPANVLNRKIVEN